MLVDHDQDEQIQQPERAKAEPKDRAPAEGGDKRIHKSVLLVNCRIGGSGVTVDGNLHPNKPSSNGRHRANHKCNHRPELTKLLLNQTSDNRTEHNDEHCQDLVLLDEESNSTLRDGTGNVFQGCDELVPALIVGDVVLLDFFLLASFRVELGLLLAVGFDEAG
jgi:hypothetical protein